MRQKVTTARSYLNRWGGYDFDFDTMDDVELTNFLYSVIKKNEMRIHSRAARVLRDKVYFFDKDDTCVCRKREDTEHCIWLLPEYVGLHFSPGLWKKACCQFSEGLTLWDCLLIYVQTQLSIPQKVHFSEKERFIQKVCIPEIVCDSDNYNKSTFDRVHLVINLGKEVFPEWIDTVEAVRRYRKELDALAINRIANDRVFRKYNVPLNFLKLSELRLKRNYTLEYVFELKQLPCEERRKDDANNKHCAGAV